MVSKVLITGASSGFGVLTVEALLKNGHTVVASMRDVTARNQMIAEELTQKGAKVVEIDVTDENSVESGMRAAYELADGLDVLINNAGVGVIGLQEAFSVEDLQKVFDINVYGVHRMNRAALKFFHPQKSGFLIHVSSLLGRMTLPFYGPYNASKWALEAMAENYRTELSGLGIDVALVEPGGFPTGFIGNLIRPSDRLRETSYGDFAEAPLASINHFEEALASNPEQDPKNVANAIVDLVQAPPGARKFRTIVDNMGMGQAIEAYNEQLEKVTEHIYSAFGHADKLKLKVER